MKYDEEKLWVAVVEQAILDVTGKNRELRKEAYSWIHSTESFRTVCELANLDSERLKNMLSKIIGKKGDFMDFSSQKIKSLLINNIKECVSYLLPGGEFYQDRFYLGNLGKDKIIVEIKGEKAGNWNDIYKEKKGDILSLWTFVEGNIDSAKKWLNTKAEKNSTLQENGEKVFSVRHYLNDKSPMPKDIIGPRILTPGGLLVIGGTPKVGKSNFLLYQFLDSNRVIGGREVTLSDNAELNNRIMERINDVQEKIKEDNRREFQEQITNGDLSRSLDTILNGVLNDVKSSIIRDLNEAMNKDGEVKRSVMDDIMKKYLVEQDPEKQRISNDIEKNEKTAKDKKKERGELPKEAVQEIKKLGEEIGNKRERIKELEKSLKERTKDLNKQKQQVVDRLWEDMKVFSKRLTPWKPNNCAEPHAITALSRLNEIFPHDDTESSKMDDTSPLVSRANKVNFYDKPEDIRFLATYKLIDGNLRSSEPSYTLEPFDRCDHCLITTERFENIITDSQWIKKFNKKVLSAGPKLDFSEKRLYFLTRSTT